MQRKIMALIVGVCSVAFLVGCGNKEISNEKITIKQYEGLEIEKVEELKLTDEDIEQTVQSNLAMLELPVVERGAQLGDIVYIDYIGKKEGVAFEGGKAENSRLVLGEAGYIPGFEDGIVGHKAGDTFDLNLTFPEDYGVAELDGQAVVFTITLNELKEYYKGELTVEILPYLSETAKTIKEYKEEIRKELQVSNEATRETAIKDAAWAALTENCVVKDYPQEKLEQAIEEAKSNYSFFAMLYGMDVDAYLEAAGIDIEKEAKDAISKEYAIQLIAEKEKLTVSKEKYEEKLKELANIQGATDLEQFEKDYGKENIEKALLEELVGEFLAENCVQVEPKETGK